MQRDRLARLQRTLRERQLACVLLFDPLNVRYATAEGPFTVFNLHSTFRWALVPAESEPVLWEYPGALHVTATRWRGDLRAAEGWTYFGAGSNSGAAAARFADEIVAELVERGLDDEPVGVDRLETVAHLALAEAGVRVVDGQPAAEQARAVKTRDELVALRSNAAACDRAIGRLLEVMRPGVSEDELWSVLVGHSLERGAEWCETRLLSSGPRTNPWMQEATARVVGDGELVAFDTDLVGRHGYLTDVSRTYLCGDRAPRDEQRRLYAASYDFLQTSLPHFRPGASFEELGRRLGPLLPAEFRPQRYPFIAHGTGLVDEYPCVTFTDHHDGELEVGMVMSLESYVGAVGGARGSSSRSSSSSPRTAPSCCPPPPSTCGCWADGSSALSDGPVPRYRAGVATGTVVVTGASTGIGAATSRHLAGRGFHVLAGVRRDEDAERAESWSPRIRAVRLDVTDPGDVAALVTEVASAPSGLRALVNNAGVAVVGPVEALTVEDWRQQLEVNVLGQVAVTRALLPRLIATRGRVVMMSSIGGLVAGPLFGPYAASKFAIEAFTDVLRREVGPLGVRVVAVEPGAIATPIWERGRLAGDGRWETVEPVVRDRYAGLVRAVRELADRGARDGLPPEAVAEVVGRALTSSAPARATSWAGTPSPRPGSAGCCPTVRWTRWSAALCSAADSAPESSRPSNGDGPPGRVGSIFRAAGQPGRHEPRGEHEEVRKLALVLSAAVTAGATTLARPRRSGRQRLEGRQAPGSRWRGLHDPFGLTSTQRDAGRHRRRRGRVKTINKETHRVQHRGRWPRAVRRGQCGEGRQALRDRDRRGRPSAPAGPVPGSSVLVARQGRRRASWPICWTTSSTTIPTVRLSSTQKKSRSTPLEPVRRDRNRKRNGFVLVADGGTNDVLRVDRNGNVSTLFVPPTVNSRACKALPNNDETTVGCDAVPTGLGARRRTKHDLRLRADGRGPG